MRSNWSVGCSEGVSMRRKFLGVFGGTQKLWGFLKVFYDREFTKKRCLFVTAVLSTAVSLNPWDVDKNPQRHPPYFRLRRREKN